MKYLIKTVETYRADSEKEALEIINDAKKDGSFELTKYSSETKPVKEGGEIVDEYRLVSLCKIFDNAKEPMGNAIYNSPVEEVEGF